MSKISSTKEDLSALADVLNMDISEEDFDFSEDMSNEELVFEDNLKKSKIKPSLKEDTRDYSLITEPHWLLEKEDIHRMLDTLSNVIIPSGEIVNKSLHVQRNFNKLVFSFNSNEIQGQFDIPLLNVENLIDEDKKYILNYKDLVLAVKNSENKVILKDKVESKTLGFDVLNGEDELENYLGLDENNFIGISKVDFTNIPIKEIDHTIFSSFLKNVSYSDKLSMRPDDRKVRLQGKEAFSNYAIVIVNYKNINLDDFSMRLIDVSFLLKLLNLSNSSISLAQTEKNTFIFGDTFKISLPKVNTDDLKYVKRICGDIKIKSEFTLQTMKFYKTLNYLRQRAGNAVTTHIYVENGSLFVHSKTVNQRNLKFPVTDSLDDSINLDSKLPIMTLLNTFRLFRDYPTINVMVTDNQRFIFDVDDFRLIFGNLT